MKKEEVLKAVFENVGGEANTGKRVWKSDSLMLAVKDQSLVDLAAIEKLGFVDSCEFRNRKLKMYLTEDARKELLMTNKNYDQLAADLLEAVGGKENVALAAHCMTRLRLNLKDESKYDADRVNQLDGVAGINKVGNQYQIIIGTAVTKVYDALCELGQFEKQDAIDENLDKQKEPLSVKSVFANIMSTFSECMVPLIPVLLTSGFLRTINTILGPSTLKLISDTSNLYVLFSIVADACIYFFPFFLAYTASQKFRCSTPLSILLAGVLMSPKLLEIVAAGQPFTVYGLPMRLLDYSTTVIPTILSIYVFSLVERFVKKIMPETLQVAFVPLCSVLLMLPIMLCLTAPLGSYIADLIGMVLNGIYKVVGSYAAILISLLWTPLVITGMHVPVATLFYSSYFVLGYEGILLPGVVVGIYSMVGMLLAMLIKTKNDNRIRTIAAAGLPALLFGGVGEPVLFGIVLPYKRCLAALSIGNVAGALYIAITKTVVYTLGPQGLIMFMQYAGGSTANLINGIIACVIALAAAFTSQMLLGYKDPEKQ